MGMTAYPAFFPFQRAYPIPIKVKTANMIQAVKAIFFILFRFSLMDFLIPASKTTILLAESPKFYKSKAIAVMSSENFPPENTVSAVFNFAIKSSAPCD